MSNQTDRQHNFVAPVLDPEAAQALAGFGLRAGSALQQVTAPLEILSHLLYLAREHADDPEKLKEYLGQAQEHAQTLVRSHVDLLDAYPDPRKTPR